MLAMHSVRVMTVQAAIGTWQIDLRGTENGLDEPQKQSHAKNHDQDRQQASDRIGHGDVAEPGCRQRCHGKVERIKIVVDVFVPIVLQHKNDRCDHENENKQIDCRLEDFFVAAEPFRRVAQLLQEVIGAQQPQHADDPEECKILKERWNDQRDNNNNIGQGREARQVYRQREPAAIRRAT
jgi:hypothetical protein